MQKTDAEKDFLKITKQQGNPNLNATNHYQYRVTQGCE